MIKATDAREYKLEIQHNGNHYSTIGVQCGTKFLFIFVLGYKILYYSCFLYNKRLYFVLFNYFGTPWYQIAYQYRIGVQCDTKFHIIFLLVYHAVYWGTK